MSFPFWLPLLLGFMTAIGSISVDMYLPGLPSIARELGAIRGGAQITLVAFFIGFASGQLVFGPLADRLGRKTPLLAGMTLYIIATVGCAVTAGFVSFSIFRFLAALGGAASIVIPRAIVRDLATGPAAARLMAQLMLVMGLSPILAPALGGFVVQWAGWRTIFWIQAIYGVSNLLLAALLLPNTLPPERWVRHDLANVVQCYFVVGRDRSFWPPALMVGFGGSALFAYIGGSPEVFEAGFHISPVLYGGIFGLGGLALILSSQFNGRVIVPRFGLDRTLNVAVYAVLMASAYLAILSVTGSANLLSTITGLLVVIGALGFIFPNSTVAVMDHHHGNAGVASALTGTFQSGLGAVSGMLVGQFGDATPRAMALCLLAGSCGIALCNYLRQNVKS